MNLIRAALAEQVLRAAHLEARWRLGYHLMPPAGWVNDPNGLSWFAGQYHVFYQHNPHSAQWGPMHWGHAVSSDLVHWRHAGVALAPDQPYDWNGCHSGSAVVDAGQLTLVYTGHSYTDPDPTSRDPDRFRQTQNLAASSDGFTFIKDPGNPVLTHPPQDSTQHFRDPKVWREDTGWCMVVGNGATSGVGRALLYRSADLRRWEYVGVLAQSDGSLGSMWECPDFFELDGRHVLLISPMGMRGSPGGSTAAEHHTGALVGSLDEATQQLRHGPYAELDHGHDFYAVQTLRTPDGRRVAIGWMKVGETGVSETLDGWAGALSLPRELHVGPGDQLTMQPVAELAQLRRKVVLAGDLLVDGSLDTGVPVSTGEMILEITPAKSTAVQVGLALVTADDEVVRVVADLATGHLLLRRGGPDGARSAPHHGREVVRLRIFVDRSSIEVFTGSGLVTMTSRIYPTTTPALRLVSEGGVARFNVTVFDLEDIWGT